MLEYISVCLPFGRPVVTDHSLSKKLVMSTSTTKSKVNLKLELYFLITIWKDAYTFLIKATIIILVIS